MLSKSNAFQLCMGHCNRKVTARNYFQPVMIHVRANLNHLHILQNVHETSLSALNFCLQNAENPGASGGLRPPGPPNRGVAPCTPTGGGPPDPPSVNFGNPPLPMPRSAPEISCVLCFNHALVESDVMRLVR